MKHIGPPPGTLTLEGVLDILGMTKQNFYQAGLNDLIDFYQVRPNTPNLYDKSQVASFNYWLFVRRGLVELGVYKRNEPLANPHYEAFEAEDCYGVACPECEGDAVYDPANDERVWCPDCETVAL
ncbi:MAG: hypothetical protein ACYTEQ_09465 [Planctomycetota bacterium]|jgi:hypothetical protein